MFLVSGLVPRTFALLIWIKALLMAFGHWIILLKSVGSDCDSKSAFPHLLS